MSTDGEKVRSKYMRNAREAREKSHKRREATKGKIHGATRAVASLGGHFDDGGMMACYQWTWDRPLFLFIAFAISFIIAVIGFMVVVVALLLIAYYGLDYLNNITYSYIVWG